MKRIVTAILTHIVASIVGALGFCALVASVIKHDGSDTLKDAVISFFDILLFGYSRHPYARPNIASHSYPRFTYADYYMHRRETLDEEKEETHDEEDDE